MNETFHKSTGILRYSDPYKLIVVVDPQIVAFYRALMPKYIQSAPQMYDPHISVVRKEVPTNLDVWKKYDGEKIDFLYSNIVHRGRVYFWLNVFCQRLEEIRAELGLPNTSPYTQPPEGFLKCFHITLGNLKMQDK